MRAAHTLAWLSLLLSLSPLARAEEAGAPQAARLTRPPRLRAFVEAEYPPARKARGEEGSVELSIELDAAGVVSAVSVSRSGGEDFDAAALAAVRRFSFEPAEVDGRPAPVRLSYRYDFVLKAAAPPRTGALEGVVLERDSRRPLPGVSVAIPRLERSATTDEQGRFSLPELPAGSHAVSVSGPTLVTVHTTEEIAAAALRTVRYLVEEIRAAGPSASEEVDEEEVVRAPRLRKEAVQTAIRAEEARRVPGTQGDTLKVVQNLPGVARASFGSGQLVVWGAAPRETRVYVDGVEIPALYHLGGIRSTINSDLVRSLELVPGGYGADYGRGLGGLVKVETRPLPSSGFHGHVAADLLDLSARLSVAAGRFRLAAAGRFGYLDRILAQVVSPKVGDYVPIPRYYDWQAKATVALRRDEELSALVLASDDRIRRTVAAEDPAASRSEDTRATFYRASLRYTRLGSSGSSVAVTPFFGLDRSGSATRFGPVPTELAATHYRYGVRAEYRRRVASRLTLSLGSDTLGSYSRILRSGTLALPAREGDLYVFGRAPVDELAVDRFSAQILDLGLYAVGALTLGPIRLEPGLRLDAFFLDVDRVLPRIGEAPAVGASRLVWGVQPRLAVVYLPHPRVTLTASGGLYYQPPDPEELSSVFGNPQLGLSRAVHATLGLKVRVTPFLAVEAVGFYKYLDRLVMRSAQASPELARVLEQSGEGHSFGGQLLVRQELWKGLFGWISYTGSRSLRRNHPAAPLRLFDYDQTHVLAVVLSYEWRGFSVGTRLRYATGAPRTPVEGAYYDARVDAYQPLFGAQSSIRLPDFVQLDLRLEKRFDFRRAAFSLYLDVQNVTYRRNAEELVYAADYRERGYITGLPTLAVLGARVQF